MHFNVDLPGHLQQGVVQPAPRCAEPDRGGHRSRQLTPPAYPLGMHPITKLVVIIAVAAVVFWLVTKLRESTRGDKVSFRPVEDLPSEVQQSIDLALANGKKITAIKLYRQATKAPLDAAKAAIDVREWKRG